MFLHTGTQLLNAAKQAVAGGSRYDYLAALYYWFLFCELCKSEDEDDLLAKVAAFIEFRKLRNVLGHDIGKTMFTDLASLECAAEFLLSTIADIEQIFQGQEVVPYQTVGFEPVWEKPQVDVTLAKRQFAASCDDLLGVCDTTDINHASAPMLVIILGELAKTLFPEQEMGFCSWLKHIRDGLAHPQFTDLSGFLEEQFLQIKGYVDSCRPEVISLADPMRPRVKAPKHIESAEQVRRISAAPPVNQAYLATLVVISCLANHTEIAVRILQQYGMNILWQKLPYKCAINYRIDAQGLIYDDNLRCYQILMTIPDNNVVDLLAQYAEEIRERIHRKKHRDIDISSKIVFSYIRANSIDLFLRVVKTFDLNINTQAPTEMSAAQVLFLFADVSYYPIFLAKGGDPFLRGDRCHAVPFLLCDLKGVMERTLRMSKLIAAIPQDQRKDLVNLQNRQGISLLQVAMNVLQFDESEPGLDCCLDPAGIRVFLDYGADPTVLDPDKENCLIWLVAMACSLASDHLFTHRLCQGRSGKNLEYLQRNRKQISERLLQYLEVMLMHDHANKDTFSALTLNQTLYQVLIAAGTDAQNTISLIIRCALEKGFLLEICIWYCDEDAKELLVLFNFPAAIAAFQENRVGLEAYLSECNDYQIAKGVTIVGIPRLLQLMLEPWPRELPLNKHLNLLINAYMTLDPVVLHGLLPKGELICQVAGRDQAEFITFANLLARYRSRDEYNKIRLLFFLLRQSLDSDILMARIRDGLPQECIQLSVHPAAHFSRPRTDQRHELNQKSATSHRGQRPPQRHFR
jgi:hypothetical protein